MPLERRRIVNSSDLLCFSHLRWDFVFQRPQHLMTRAARDRRVCYFEEPLTAAVPRLDMRTVDGVHVCVPHLPATDLTDERTVRMLATLVRRFLATQDIRSPALWHYSPMFEPVTRGIDSPLQVFDCMDELRLFRFAPAEIEAREDALLRRVQLVFAGGRKLYEARRERHPSVHLFPSSVDAAHFRTARSAPPEPDSLSGLDRPRLMYVGVIDERLDLPLIAGLASARPDWQWVYIGPVVKIDPADLPQAANLHWLGRRDYRDLPAHLAHADAGLLPFALNDATRFISPTKTPEYLAAGLPVASTPIEDVVRDWGERGLVEIGRGTEFFIAACERALCRSSDSLVRVDAALDADSWDRTWARMADLMDAALAPASTTAPLLQRDTLSRRVPA
jgi:glycosyltransferase involved in cell wall biosynthesis